MRKIFFILLLVHSVWGFANYEQGEGTNGSDVAINHVIYELLAHRKQTQPSQNVFITTKNGSVFLYGQVESDKSRQEIIQMVAAIPGVRRVSNQMSIKVPLDQNWPLIEGHAK